MSETESTPKWFNFCYSEKCCGRSFKGVIKPVPLGRKLCPDCGHLLVVRTEKHRRNCVDANEKKMRARVKNLRAS